jgi:hypothetical protein
MQLKIAAAVLLGATAVHAQCTVSSAEIRTFDPWSASFYYPSQNGNTLNQYLDLTVDAPLTINQMYSTSYDQAAGATAPPDQVGNIAEVRLYTFPVTHVGAELSQTGWTHVSSAEMTVVAWNGDCLIQNFKDPVTGVPTPFVLPVGTYGFCVEYIPTSWSGTALLPQTNVPLLNPGSLSCLGFDPGLNYPVIMAEDEFLSINSGGIQGTGWQTVDLTGALIANAAPGAPFTDQPNLGFDYTPDPAAGVSQSIGEGCYNLPFMLYEQIPANTTPVDLVNTSYTIVLTPSANGGFYTIVNGGLPYLAPPVGATNLTQGGTAATPVANSSGTLDDCTFSHTLLTPISIPSPGGGLQATELGINSNGKIYFDTVPPSDTSFGYNGANYGGITGFRDLAAQWALFNTDFDPTVGGDIYVMEPSPNLGGIMIWYDNVPNWPAVPGVVNSCSIEFTSDGSVGYLAYGSALACDGGGNDAIIGFSAGNGEPASASIDWSGIPSSPGAQLSGDGSSAPTLELAARPVASTTVDLVMGNLPANTLGAPGLGLFILSLTPSPLPVDLGFIGAPGCALIVGGSPSIASGIEVPGTGEIRLPFPIPGAAFAGTDIFLQGAAYHWQLPPNALGFTVTNGVCFRIGTL